MRIRWDDIGFAAAPNLAPSFSGGKDSLALLLKVFDLGKSHQIADIVTFDTGWEYPAMYALWAEVQGYLGMTLTVLRPRVSFDALFAEHVVNKRNGEKQKGYGWPKGIARWCTAVKRDAIRAHCNALTWRNGLSLPIIQLIGFAADETGRVDALLRDDPYQAYCFPLVDWGMTEADCLAFCRDVHGFDWGGLYEHFSRASCCCCPQGGEYKARITRKHFPDIWWRMLVMQLRLPDGHPGRCFAGKKTIIDLERQFEAESAGGEA